MSSITVIATTTETGQSIAVPKICQYKVPLKRKVAVSDRHNISTDTRAPRGMFVNNETTQNNTSSYP